MQSIIQLTDFNSITNYYRNKINDGKAIGNTKQNLEGKRGALEDGVRVTAGIGDGDKVFTHLVEATYHRINCCRH